MAVSPVLDCVVQCTRFKLDCQVQIGYHSIMAKARGPATAKGRAMRERILQAAAELIAEKGTAGMSLDDVRVRTGASRSQLYHYFEDRDDLVHAVIDVTIDAALATATMASIQGGLLLTQVRRDPHQLRIALNAARNNLRVAAA